MFVSYSDDSPAHAKRVLELAQWLRNHGIDAQIDQFEESPEEGWPRWIYRQIRESEFVLIIASPGYLRRCEGEEPGADATGSSIKFGSHLTLQELHEAGGRNRRFVPVLFDDDAIVESVPLPLRGATCYRLPSQREDLYRRLTGQPRVKSAPLGALLTFDESLRDSTHEIDRGTGAPRDQEHDDDEPYRGRVEHPSDTPVAGALKPSVRSNVGSHEEVRNSSQRRFRPLPFPRGASSAGADSSASAMASRSR